jgi:hypothetical protein
MSKTVNSLDNNTSVEDLPNLDQ